MDKPAASRSESAEIYVLGLKYKAPAKIDPRLLDFKHLFQGSIEPQAKVITNLFWGMLGLQYFFVYFYLHLIFSFGESLTQVVDVLRENKQKRHRDG